ncbi:MULTISPECIES: cupin domain-containing protein [unclassified Marinobacter]|uniref:cupin domain-containing protein n=1 Tax=unclassified Marinobacter TaxID=83889 RepID=UPI000C01E66A|nr:MULTISPECIES: cupin domain-containing protein [unclassified Marinobacter]PFG11435.1 Cupin domain-containing protein [Marinobacter sp. LV10MA510-1]PFG53263.1 Cupin domain-containing protein [Marinobacter sp. LV10R520-4]
MSIKRIFPSANHLQPVDGEPFRSVITESVEAAIVAWYVKPGQRVSAHLHPEGQDTWTILSGHGQYQLDAAGSSKQITAGDVVVAHKGEVHGVLNTGSEPLVFISVVCPALSGFELLESQYAHTEI